ncbi:MAG: hypothetical protein IPM80_03710 [Proteobacteria bacterium]|nr:hypothetical protein [Pseudomonadota bacterium]
MLKVSSTSSALIIEYLPRTFISIILINTIQTQRGNFLSRVSVSERLYAALQPAMDYNNFEAAARRAHAHPFWASVTALT